MLIYKVGDRVVGTIKAAPRSIHALLYTYPPVYRETSSLEEIKKRCFTDRSSQAIKTQGDLADVYPSVISTAVTIFGERIVHQSRA
jgi:hypothetical protein